MALSMLTSTLQALKSFDQKLADVPPLSQAQMTLSWPDRWRKTFRMILISAAVAGIELCYSAETAFVSPLLLQLGVPVYLMTLCWMASPVLGFFLVPILGSASDTCTSPLGRRRPFIIFYSAGIVLGLLLVPYGKDIGELAGDHGDTFVEIFNDSSNVSTSNQTYTYSTKSLTESSHPVGIIVTVIGVVLLDFCCDGCQTPCRTLMIDLSTVNDQSQGLATFTVIAGLGGAVGYAVGGIRWSKHILEFPLDPEFSTHIHAVFGVVLVIFLIGSLITIFSVQEKSIGSIHQRHKYKRLYNCEQNSMHDKMKSKSDASLLQSAYSLSTEATGENDSVEKVNDGNIIVTPADGDGERDGWTNVEEDDEVDISDAGMKVFLKSIIFMPKHMWLLCLCNLFCWMSLVTYSLYFTDYVGQAIYNGVPSNSPDSKERATYEDGVRMGSLAMVLYSLSCTVYSLCIVQLINRFGTKAVYVLGQLVYCAGMTILSISGHIVMVFIGSLTAGFMYATLFTLPYMLIAKYHCDVEFLKLHSGEGEKRKRGLGTDIAIVSSMVFAGQFLLSLFIGALVHAVGSTVVIPVTAAVLSFCGAMTAFKLEYVKD